MSEKRFTVLIVDDSEINRAILKEILRADYDVLEAEGGEQAIDILKEKSDEIALVMLDVLMPAVDGYDVLEFMGDNSIIVDVPVIMLSTESSTDFMARAFDMGAVDYVSRPFDPTIVQLRVKNTITLFAKKRILVDIVAGQVYEKEKYNRLVTSILSNIVEFRTGENSAHVIRVNLITELLLRELMKKTDSYRLTMSCIRRISVASSLHDIGKIKIPEEILNKPDKLTAEEFEVIKTHSEIGASMIKSIAPSENEPLLETACEICRWHHERYDGSGYPDGLRGDDIPISAQVAAIADVYDVLTSERCYKKAYTHKKAIKMICDGECGSFNPLLLQCLLDIEGKLKELLQNNVLMLDGKYELQSLVEEITDCE
ncbi:MAG: HD domain-containing phosphohydrolase [Oscillospiraceae bacterium]